MALGYDTTELYDGMLEVYRWAIGSRRKCVSKGLWQMAELQTSHTLEWSSTAVLFDALI